MLFSKIQYYTHTNDKDQTRPVTTTISNSYDSNTKLNKNKFPHLNCMLQPFIFHTTNSNYKNWNIKCTLLSVRAYQQYLDLPKYPDAYQMALGSHISPSHYNLAGGGGGGAPPTRKPMYVNAIFVGVRKQHNIKCKKMHTHSSSVTD
jgi:hypothetical protein